MVAPKNSLRRAQVLDLLEHNIACTAAGLAVALGLERYQARDTLHAMEREGSIIRLIYAPGAFAIAQYTQRDPLGSTSRGGRRSTHKGNEP